MQRFVQHSGGLYIPTVVLGELYAWAYRRPDPASLIDKIEHDLLLDVVVLGYSDTRAQRVRADLPRWRASGCLRDLRLPELPRRAGPAPRPPAVGAAVQRDERGPARRAQEQASGAGQTTTVFGTSSRIASPTEMRVTIPATTWQSCTSGSWCARRSAPGLRPRPALRCHHEMLVASSCKSATADCKCPSCYQKRELVHRAARARRGLFSRRAPTSGFAWGREAWGNSPRSGGVGISTLRLCWVNLNAPSIPTDPRLKELGVTACRQAANPMAGPPLGQAPIINSDQLQQPFALADNRLHQRWVVVPDLV